MKVAEEAQAKAVKESVSGFQKVGAGAVRPACVKRKASMKMLSLSPPSLHTEQFRIYLGMDVHMLVHGWERVVRVVVDKVLLENTALM